MLLVLQRHRLAQASLMGLLCEAISAGVAPPMIGDKGLPAYHAFMDRMRNIAEQRRPDDDSAAEDRAWAIVDRLAG